MMRVKLPHVMLTAHLFLVVMATTMPLQVKNVMTAVNPQTVMTIVLCRNAETETTMYSQVKNVMAVMTVHQFANVKTLQIMLHT